MKKILALVLAMVMTLGLVACAPAADDTKGTTVPVDTYVDPYASIEDYDELSAELYEDILGEFNTAYTAAKAAATVSERWALMAVAEAKLMESAIMLPLSSNGGNYAISRVAPYTAPNALWGNDSYRYHNVVVASEPITEAHREEMKSKWNELKGTGNYEAWAKSFLTEKGYTIKDSYTLGYSSDPQTWDVLATSMAADSEAIVNTYDGLVEYDCENTLKPALAESWTKTENADGTVTYTFKIRAGQVWVNSQGQKVADLKADDFVAGFQHMLDAAGGLEYLAEGVIVNASEYLNGTVTDFAQVGVKAVDETTLTYTLCGDITYFMTMLGYGVFAPMSREYFLTQGGAFGADYAAAAEAETYTYGTTPNNIAYCGPYVVTNATEKNTIVFKANASYWNAANINNKTITWLYNDGEDALKAYNDTINGVIDGAGLNSSALAKAKEDGKFDTLAYVSGCDATSFMGFYNFNRAMMHNFNDEAAVVSTKTEADVVRSNAALQNVHFRRAVSFAADRGAYNAMVVGEELKLTSLRNCYTPGNFVALEEDVTISINGTDTTFKAGTYYGAIMQAQIDADGVKIKVWDPEAEAGAGSSDGYDGWYNAENAVAELNIAISELEAKGLYISAAKPIQIDVPYWSSNESYANRAQAYKQSVETVLGGKVIINLVACVDVMQWYNAGYYPPTGAEANYDMCDISGWGPDYGDPQTYLDTMLPEYAGYMVKALGIY